RPNPNGFFVDGPVLDTAFRSFVGMHPVPLVHGMTIGEYARMINGQGWLKGGVQCALTVVPCTGYHHGSHYALPVRPSPNLPNMAAVYLYPALGLFEGTIVSVGRGTDKPFQCIGFPGCTLGDHRFTPRSMPGAKDPPHRDQPCTGLDLASYGEVYTRLAPASAWNGSSACTTPARTRGSSSTPSSTSSPATPPCARPWRPAAPKKPSAPSGNRTSPRSRTYGSPICSIRRGRRAGAG